MCEQTETVTNRKKSEATILKRRLSTLSYSVGGKSFISCKGQPIRLLSSFWETSFRERMDFHEACTKCPLSLSAPAHCFPPGQGAVRRRQYPICQVTQR